MGEGDDQNQHMGGGGVTVHSKLTAVSSKPTGPGKTHPLTPFDRAMALHTLHLVFYYPNSPFKTFDVDPLKLSLSEVLSLYPPLTGRLTRRHDTGDWEINCNDAGVRIFRAKVGVPMEEWLRSGKLSNEERQLTFWEDMPENPSTWSPFQFQISEFEGGGVAIGLSCTHMLADLTNLALFHKSWTETHRRQPITHPPVYSPALFHTRAVPNTSTPRAQINSSTTMATAIFKFSDSVIRQCLSEIHDQCSDASPFDLLAALFWTRIAYINTSSSQQSLATCLDVRRRLKEPLPYGYFGNVLHFSPLSVEEDQMDVFGELGRVVDLIHHHVLEQEDILSSVVDYGLESPFSMYGPQLTCVSLEHMIVEDGSNFLYAAAFEDDVKPCHVSCHVGNVEGEGVIVVMPSLEAGLARTVMVTIPEEDMVKLCQDEAILTLSRSGSGV